MDIIRKMLRIFSLWIYFYTISTERKHFNAQQNLLKLFEIIEQKKWKQDIGYVSASIFFWSPNTFLNVSFAQLLSFTMDRLDERGSA